MSEVKPKQVKKPKPKAPPKPKVDKVAERQAEQKKMALAIAVSIYHYKWIAASVGITEDALRIWREADPDFSANLEVARSQFINKNMKKARADYLLETADRETFGKEAKIDITGDLTVALVEFVGDDEQQDNQDQDTSTPAV